MWNSDDWKRLILIVLQTATLWFSNQNSSKISAVEQKVATVQLQVQAVPEKVATTAAQVAAEINNKKEVK